jgi:hypothetical protein
MEGNAAIGPEAGNVLCVEPVAVGHKDILDANI